MISRCIGAKDYDKASNSALHSILIGVIVSVLIPLVSLPFMKDILVLIGGGEVLALASDYAVVLMIGSFAFIFNMLLSSQLRAEGDIKRATIIMVSADIFNIVLDSIFIYTFNMGVGGAALATVIANALPIIFAVYWLFLKKDTYLDYSIRKFKYDYIYIKGILEVGIPASVEQLLMSIAGMVLNLLLIMVSDTTTVAAFSVSFTLMDIDIMPGMAIGTALITVAGVAYGAKDYQMLKSVSRYALVINMIIAVILTIALIVFAPQLAYIFAYSNDSQILYNLIIYTLQVESLFVLFAPIGIICANIFQSMGKGLYSLILTTLRELIFVIIFSYIGGVLLGFGTIGIYMGFVVAITLGTVISYISIEYYIKHLIKNYNKI